MADRELLGKMCHASIMCNVRDGRAPHYTEFAKQLGLPPEDARFRPQ
jgi:hypothetical protein